MFFIHIASESTIFKLFLIYLNILQKTMYNKNNDRVCAHVWAPCIIASTIIYFILNILLKNLDPKKNKR